MAYTEKLSEQIAVIGGAQDITTVATAPSTATVSLIAPVNAAPAFDMGAGGCYHRLAAIAYGRADATSSTTTAATITATASFNAAIVIKALTATNISMTATGAATTILVSTTLTVSEQQRAVFTGTAGGTTTATAEGWAGADIEASEYDYETYPYIRASVTVQPVSNVIGNQAIAAAAVIAGEPRFRPANVTN